MKKLRLPSRLLAVSTTAAVVLSGASVALAEEGTEDNVTISVSNITDLHGHLASEPSLDDNDQPAPEAGDPMGVAYLQALIEKVNENQEYAMTTSGDNVGGSAFISAISEDEYTIDALNAMGVKASAVGNHEFDKGTADLVDRIEPRSDFPILGGNVLKDGEPLLEASHVEEIDGVKVGFVGTVTENTKYKVAPDAIPGITFTDPVETTNQEATRLKEEGEADVVVALMHEDAQQYAEGFNKDVDVLFGGDTHVKSQGSVQRQDALPLQWAQGWEYGRLLNDADITFDKTQKKVSDIELTQYDYSNLEGIEADPALAGIVDEAAAKAEELGAEIVGESPANLYRGSNEGEVSGSNRGVESTLNNFIAQAQREQMTKNTGKSIDIGVMNAGGVRADLKQGEVSYADIFTVQPFGNSVSYGEISGSDFIQALENQWQEGDRPRLDLGLSDNVQVVYDQTAGQGERIKSVTIDGEQIAPEETYTIAASTFLIGGGDGFFPDNMIKNTVDVGALDTQVMIDYIKSGNSQVRTGQSQIGVHVDGNVNPGEEITVELSSLNYTTEGEPMAEEATVKLGNAEATAEIDNTAREGDDNVGERGRASVKLSVPEGLSGTENLEVTTNIGTSAVLPIQVGEQDGGVTTEGSSPSEGIVAVILAALVGIVGVVGLSPQLLPAPVRQIIDNFRNQFIR